MKSSLRKLVVAAMMAAICCVATYLSFPIPGGQGYIHTGDAFVLLSGWLLGPVYGFAAAAIGSALTDVLLGYIVYAPVTFAIKGCMALIAWLLMRVIFRSGFAQGKSWGRLIAAAVCGALCAELLMICGYFILEIFLYGVGGALAGVPYNCIQGAFGVVLGTVLSTVFYRIRQYTRLNG